MTQTINFYQPEFHRSHDYKKWALRSGIGLAVALLVVINLVQQASINRLSAERQQKQDQLASRKLLHQTLETQLQPKQQSPMVLAQLESSRHANQSRLKALNFLSHRETDNMVGFSFLLDALGRQRDKIEGIWLKKIQFDNGGYHLSLDGYSHSAELLPQLVQTLSKKKSCVAMNSATLKFHAQPNTNRLWISNWIPESANTRPILPCRQSWHCSWQN